MRKCHDGGEQHKFEPRYDEQGSKGKEMTKHFCDRCGQPIKYPLMCDVRTDPEGTRNAVQEHRYELCNQCAKYIEDSITLNPKRNLE